MDKLLQHREAVLYITRNSRSLIEIPTFGYDVTVFSDMTQRIRVLHHKQITKSFYITLNIPPFLSSYLLILLARVQFSPI